MALEQMSQGYTPALTASFQLRAFICFLFINGGGKHTLQGCGKGEIKQGMRYPTQCLTHSRCLKQAPSLLFTLGL